MPPLPGCISRLVLQADHPVVGLHVRHMSNNNMNICAIFWLNLNIKKLVYTTQVNSVFRAH